MWKEIIPMKFKYKRKENCSLLGYERERNYLSSSNMKKPMRTPLITRKFHSDLIGWVCIPQNNYGVTERTVAKLTQNMLLLHVKIDPKLCSQA